MHQIKKCQFLKHNFYLSLSLSSVTNNHNIKSTLSSKDTLFNLKYMYETKHLGELNFRIIWLSKTIVVPHENGIANSTVWQLRTDWCNFTKFDRSLCLVALSHLVAHGKIMPQSFLIIVFHTRICLGNNTTNALGFLGESSLR